MVVGGVGCDQIKRIEYKEQYRELGHWDVLGRIRYIVGGAMTSISVSRIHHYQNELFPSQYVPVNIKSLYFLV